MGQPDPGTVSSGYVTTNKTIGSTSFPWLSLHTTICRTQRPWSPHSLLTRVFIPKSKCPLNLLCQTLLTKSPQILRNYTVPPQPGLLCPQTIYEVHSASRCRQIPPFNVGDTVWLDLWNIRTTRPSKKLNHQFLGPFPI